MGRLTVNMQSTDFVNMTPKFKLSARKSDNVEKFVIPELIKKQNNKITDSEYEEISSAKDINDTPDSEVIPNTDKKNTTTSYYDDGSYCVYEKDDQGRNIKRTDYDSNGVLYGTLEYTYNDDGSKVYTSKNVQNIITQITNVDKNGNVTHNSWFNDDGTLRNTEDSTYDENGIRTSHTKDAAGNILNFSVYDTVNNKRISNICYSADGKILSYDKYEYKDDLSLIETSYNADGTIITTAKYNSNGTINTIEYYGGTGEILERTDFCYSTNSSLELVTDNQNNLLKIREFGSKNQLVYETPNNPSKQDLEIAKLTLESYLPNLTQQLSSLQMPVPPQLNNYISADGNIDIDGYDAAFDKYKAEVDNYQVNSDELYGKINRFCNAIENTNIKIAVKDIETKFSKVDNTIDEMKLSPYCNDEIIENLKLQLEPIKQQVADEVPNDLEELKILSNRIEKIMFNAMSSVIKNKINKLSSAGETEEARKLSNRLNISQNAFVKLKFTKNLLEHQLDVLIQRLNKLNVPTPPSTADCTENGVTNDELYLQEYNKYVKQMEKFERISSRIQSRIDIIASQMDKNNENIKDFQSKMTKWIL